MSVTGSQTAATPLIIGASLSVVTPHTDRRGRRMAAAFESGQLAPPGRGRAGPGAGAVHAQHDVGHRRQALRGDRLPARVAEPVRALVELGQRPLGALELGLERRADADLREAADGLDRPVADALAETLRRAALRA